MSPAGEKSEIRDCFFLFPLIADLQGAEAIDVPPNALGQWEGNPLSLAGGEPGPRSPLERVPGRLDDGARVLPTRLRDAI